MQNGSGAMYHSADDAGPSNRGRESSANAFLGDPRNESSAFPRLSHSAVDGVDTAAYQELSDQDSAALEYYSQRGPQSATHHYDVPTGPGAEYHSSAHHYFEDGSKYPSTSSAFTHIDYDGPSTLDPNEASSSYERIPNSSSLQNALSTQGMRTRSTHADLVIDPQLVNDDTSLGDTERDDVTS